MTPVGELEAQTQRRVIALFGTASATDTSAIGGTETTTATSNLGSSPASSSVAAIPRI